MAHFPRTSEGYSNALAYLALKDIPLGKSRTALEAGRQTYVLRLANQAYKQEQAEQPFSRAQARGQVYQKERALAAREQRPVRKARIDTAEFKKQVTQSRKRVFRITPKGTSAPKGGREAKRHGTIFKQWVIDSPTKDADIYAVWDKAGKPREFWLQLYGLVKYIPRGHGHTPEGPQTLKFPMTRTDLLDYMQEGNEFDHEYDNILLFAQQFSRGLEWESVLAITIIPMF